MWAPLPAAWAPPCSAAWPLPSSARAAPASSRRPPARMVAAAAAAAQRPRRRRRRPHARLRRRRRPRRRRRGPVAWRGPSPRLRSGPAGRQRRLGGRCCGLAPWSRPTRAAGAARCRQRLQQREPRSRSRPPERCWRSSGRAVWPRQPPAARAALGMPRGGQSALHEWPMEWPCRAASLPRAGWTL